jgi:hypothetical protein
MLQLKSLPAIIQSADQARRLHKLVGGDMSTFANVYELWQSKKIIPIGILFGLLSSRMCAHFKSSLASLHMFICVLGRFGRP